MYYFCLFSFRSHKSRMKWQKKVAVGVALLDFKCALYPYKITIWRLKLQYHCFLGTFEHRYFHTFYINDKTVMHCPMWPQVFVCLRVSRKAVDAVYRRNAYTRLSAYSPSCVHVSMRKCVCAWVVPFAPIHIAEIVCTETFYIYAQNTTFSTSVGRVLLSCVEKTDVLHHLVWVRCCWQTINNLFFSPKWNYFRQKCFIFHFRERTSK